MTSAIGRSHTDWGGGGFAGMTAAARGSLTVPNGCAPANIVPTPAAAQIAKSARVPVSTRRRRGRAPAERAASAPSMSETSISYSPAWHVAAKHGDPPPRNKTHSLIADAGSANLSDQRRAVVKLQPWVNVPERS